MKHISLYLKTALLAVISVNFCYSSAAQRAKPIQLRPIALKKALLVPKSQNKAIKPIIRPTVSPMIRPIVSPKLPIMNKQLQRPIMGQNRAQLPVIKATKPNKALAKPAPAQRILGKGAQQKTAPKIIIKKVTPTAKPKAKPAVIKSVEKPVKKVADFNCIICTDDKELRDVRFLECDHGFCADCLTTIVDGAIKEQRTTTLRCPDCSKPLSDNDIRQISPARLERINEIRLKEFFDKNPNTKQCPTTDCSHRFINDDDQPHTMQCPQCNQSYCAQCLIQHDASVTCAQAQFNLQVKQALKNTKIKDKETYEWLATNTKACPNCKKRIEKNNGCNHMHCRQCDHHFCWLCLGPYQYQDHVCKAMHGDLPAVITEPAVRTHLPVKKVAIKISTRIALNGKTPQLKKAPRLVIRKAMPTLAQQPLSHTIVRHR